MKRIIAIVPDDIAGTILSSLLEVSSDFRIEHVANGQSLVEPHKKKNFVSGETGGTLIMKHYSPDAIFTAAAANQWLISHGYSSNTSASWLGRLVKAGYVRSLGSGRFQFVKPAPSDELSFKAGLK